MGSTAVPCPVDCARLHVPPAMRQDIVQGHVHPQVAPDGTYTPPPASNQKASYATMVYVRGTIVEGAGWALARSVTIAVRAPRHGLFWPPWGSASCSVDRAHSRSDSSHQPWQLVRQNRSFVQLLQPAKRIR